MRELYGVHPISCVRRQQYSLIELNPEDMEVVLKKRPSSFMTPTGACHGAIMRPTL